MTAHGALIVHDDNKPPYRYDDDITLILGDHYAESDEKIEAGLLADPFKWSGEPSAIILQGNSGNRSFNAAPDLTCAPHVVDVDPGKTYRIRVISATALSLVKIGIEHHEKLQVIEADGAYTKKVMVDHSQVSSGQRFSYLLKTKPAKDVCEDEKSQFWIRYESRDRPQEITGYALLRYRCGKSPSLPTSLPNSPPITLPEATNDYLEYTLESLTDKKDDGFPRLSEVTRTVTIQINQVLTTGNYTNGTLNGTVAWA